MSESSGPFGGLSVIAGGAPTPEDLVGYPMNDLGNAQRLMRLAGAVINADGTVDHSRSLLLYLRDRGWIAFNGRYWDLKGGEEAARRWTHKVAQTLVGLYDAAMAKALPAKEWLKFVQGAGSSGSSSAMLAQAASYLTVELKAFDRDPLALNVRNGTLRFSRDQGGAKVTLQARHDPADRLTRICEATYDPEAKRPLFDRHVAWCLEEPEVQGYLKTLFGYICTGSTKEQVFAILQGKGGDGKSTLVNAIRDVLGSYAVTAAIETFLDTGVKQSSQASPDLARLAGDTRLISTSEPPRNSKLASGAIKSFTGGGHIVARELRQGIFEFSPIGKVVLECNAKPVINDTDDGIWRRVRIILFKRQVPKEQRDNDLPDKLAAEASGILNWLVEGVLSWIDDGLVTPAAIDEVLDDYRRGSNTFAEWFADRVIVDPKAEEGATAFHKDYKTWCEDNGHDRPMSQTAFGRAMSDLQILTRKNSAGNKVRVGARLRKASDGDYGGISPGGHVAGGDYSPGPEDVPWD